MRIETFKRPAIAKVREHYANAGDAFLVCDLGGLAEYANKQVSKTNRCRRDCVDTREWTGRKSYADSVRAVRSGDMSGVAASDKIMSDLETAIPLSQSWRTIHDVVGGVPNVPAYLAGHPLNMRRRQRVVSERGALSILVSLELSGAIEISTMRTRGAAILALVRCLSVVRPIELFVCCSVGEGVNRERALGGHMICKVDTTPLDLARAAHVLTCPSVTRGIGYAVCGQLLTTHYDNGEWSGNWAYGSDSVYRSNAREILASVAAPSNETLYVAAAHYNDPCVSKPVEWIKQKLVEYGGIEMEDAA